MPESVQDNIPKISFFRNTNNNHYVIILNYKLLLHTYKLSLGDVTVIIIKIIRYFFYYLFYIIYFLSDFITFFRTIACFQYFGKIYILWNRLGIWILCSLGKLNHFQIPISFVFFPFLFSPKQCKSIGEWTKSNVPEIVSLSTAHTMMSIV